MHLTKHIVPLSIYVILIADALTIDSFTKPRT